MSPGVREVDELRASTTRRQGLRSLCVSRMASLRAQTLTIMRNRPAQVCQARQPRAQLPHHRPRRLVRTSSSPPLLLPAESGATCSLAIIKRLISTLSVPDNLRREMKPPTWLESISKCKSRQIGPEQYRVEREAAGAVDPEKSEWVARVYECVVLPPDFVPPLRMWVDPLIALCYPPTRAYEEELAKSNALDFDDLLVRGYVLRRIRAYTKPSLTSLSFTGTSSSKITREWWQRSSRFSSTRFVPYASSRPIASADTEPDARSSRTPTRSSTTSSSSSPPPRARSPLSETRTNQVRLARTRLRVRSLMEWSALQSTDGATPRLRISKRCSRVS